VINSKKCIKENCNLYIEIWPKTGGPLSPSLFDFTLEKIIRNTYDDRKMEISNEQVMLAYADDMVMGETKEEIINATSKLKNASKEMGLHINDGKTT